MPVIPNTAKEKLKAGELAIGLGLRQARTVDTAKIAKVCGFDWLFIDLEHNAMGIDTLVPLGLMVNEIITNSLKHSFPESIQKPKIYLKIEFTDLKEYQMSIGDNGTGIPPNVNFEFPDSLGMELIQTLAEQLEGEIKFDTSKPGTHYVVTFKNLDIKGIIHH